MRVGVRPSLRVARLAVTRNRLQTGAWLHGYNHGYKLRCSARIGTTSSYTAILVLVRAGDVRVLVRVAGSPRPLRAPATSLCQAPEPSSLALAHRHGRRPHDRSLRPFPSSACSSRTPAAAVVASTAPHAPVRRAALHRTVPQHRTAPHCTDASPQEAAGRSALATHRTGAHGAAHRLQERTASRRTSAA
jgi:hypothetical protein